jgi:hypothetical protein
VLPGKGVFPTQWVAMVEYFPDYFENGVVSPNGRAS